MAIEFYKEFGDLGYLASYSNHGFYIDDVFYKTVEHYYQAKKFDNKEIINKILNCDTPKEASIIGRDRKNTRIDNFKDIKLSVMYKGVLEKFRQNSDIRAKLIETRNQKIKEMTVKESYWGVGPEKDGENHMGKILMKVRRQLKKDLIDKMIEDSICKRVYVLGHRKPDPDSVFSALILTNILKSFGIDAVFAVRDNDFVEKKLINDYLKEDYEIVDNYKNKKFILVDHNNLDGINKDDVIISIDHHIITGEIDNLIEIEYASCGLLIYDLFKRIYKFNNKEKKLIALTVLSDTEYLVSSRFTKEDKKLYKELELNIDEKKFQKKYFEITDFSKDIIINLKNNYKEYDNGKIKRSMIYSYTKEYKKYYEEYTSKLKDNNINLLIWCDYENKKTYVNYNGKDFVFPYFTSSTNLILKYIRENNILF